MFVDASAVVAIFALEPEREEFRDKIHVATIVLMSPLTVYEATLAMARIGQSGLDGAHEIVRSFVEDTKTRLISIDRDVGEAALDAFVRFGKGRHRAGLNMGDCFSYACARVHGVPLLFKGDDFVHTDISAA